MCSRIRPVILLSLYYITSCYAFTLRFSPITTIPHILEQFSCVHNAPPEHFCLNARIFFRTVSDNLSKDAHVFQKQAVTLKRNMWWKNAKVRYIYTYTHMHSICNRLKKKQTNEYPTGLSCVSPFPILNIFFIL